jgi:hypothetical protein
MDPKVADRPPYGSVEEYVRLLRRANQRAPRLDAYALALVQVIANDEFVDDAVKVERIRNVAAAAELLDGEPAPLRAVPNGVVLHAGPGAPPPMLLSADEPASAE